MGLASITNNIITDTSIPSANVITGTLGTGQVAYGSAANTIAGSVNLFWDATNSNLGIGATPATGNRLHVGGNIFTNTLSTNGGIDLNRNGDEARITFQRDGSPTAQLRALSAGGFRITGAAATTEWARFSNTGNFSLGVDTDDGVNKLQVAGSAKITGDTLVTGNLTMNRSGGGTFSVQGNQFLHDAVSTVGQLVFISSTGSAGKMIFPSASSGMNLYPGANNELNTSAHLRITSRLLSSANGVQVSIATNATGPAITGTFAATGTYGLDSLNNLNGGSLSGVRIAESFTANIATQNIAYSGFTFVSTINQSTAVGLTAVTRGVHINPTITAAVDFRAIEWSNNVATAPAVSWGLYGAGTAPNYLGGALSIGVIGGSQGLRIGRAPTNADSSSNLVNVAIPSTSTTVYRAFASSIGLNTSGFTLPNLSHFEAIQDGAFTVGVVTNHYGFRVNTLLDGTNVYAFHSNIPAATGRWNLYMNGTAINYLNGALLIGSATDDTVNKLQVTGTAVAGSNTSTVGSVILRGYYTSGYLTTFGTDASSGGPMISYAVESAQTSTEGAFVSSTPNLTTPRSAYTVSSNHRWYTAPASTTAVGTAIALTKHMELYNSGNLVLGGAAEVAGSKLQVIGNAFIKGSTNNATAAALTVQNSDGNALLSTRNDGTLFYGPNNQRGYLAITDALSTLGSVILTSQSNLTISNTRATVASLPNGSLFITRDGIETSTASTLTNILIVGHTASTSFAPTSGSALFTTQLINSRINQTGSANGITRGLYIQPTLTAAADWRSIEWDNNSGWGLYGLGTAPNYLAGELWIGYTTDQGAYSLQVNGSVYATSYFESSDIRLKDVIIKKPSIGSFGAIQYKWKDGRDDKMHWGYSAQDVMNWIPDSVNINNDGHYTLDYNQAHTYKIATLEDRIALLEQEIEQLKNK